MADRTSIEWTEATWNPVTGCDRISPGCDNCYALKLAKRLKAMGSAKYQADGDPRTSGPGFGVTTHADTVLDPVVRWPQRSQRLVFVNSMSDLFHARVPTEFIAKVFAVMALTRHTYQVLTKRPKRARQLLSENQFKDAIFNAMLELRKTASVVWSAAQTRLLDWPARQTPWPLPNVWLGTSIESDSYSWRAEELRRVPAAVRFLSCEPLLGPLNLGDLAGIHWVIAGGESGANARPMAPDWARSLRDRCQEAGVPFFFKQWGEWAPAGRGIGMAQHNVGREVLVGQRLDDMGHRQVMRRVGKHAAGRMLDGRTWDERPSGPMTSTSADKTPTDRKDTTMPGTPVTDLHGFGLTFHQTGPLQRAEITSVEQLADLVDDHDENPEGSQLAAVPGFGPARVQKVRAAVHAWKAARK